MDEQAQPTELYALDRLMQETRRLAAEFRAQTDQVLPVTAELARYDAARLLGYTAPNPPLAGVDLIGTEDYADRPMQVKGRVLTDGKPGGERVGQMNESGLWDVTLLVLYSANYEPTEIHALDKETLILEANRDDGKRKRGAISVAKFLALGHCVWSKIW